MQALPVSAVAPPPNTVPASPEEFLAQVREEARATRAAAAVCVPRPSPAAPGVVASVKQAPPPPAGARGSPAWRRRVVADFSALRAALAAVDGEMAKGTRPPAGSGARIDFDAPLVTAEAVGVVFRERYALVVRAAAGVEAMFGGGGGEWETEGYNRLRWLYAALAVVGRPMMSEAEASVRAALVAAAAARGRSSGRVTAALAVVCVVAGEYWGQWTEAEEEQEDRHYSE